MMVMCTAHGIKPHPMTGQCEYPHEVAPPASTPSMTAAETLDPREAITP